MLTGLIQRIRHNHHLTPEVQYYPHPLPDPGTQALVYVPSQTLPLLAIQGQATFFKMSFGPLQTSPLVYNQTVLQAGIGGLQAGTYVLSPLALSDQADTTPA